MYVDRAVCNSTNLYAYIIKFHTETERRIFLENNPKFKSGGRPYKRKDKTPAIWMNDGNKNRVIKQPEISDYLGRGWVRGRK
jgi:hypothetical protein